MLCWVHWVAHARTTCGMQAAMWAAPEDAEEVGEQLVRALKRASGAVAVAVEAQHGYVLHRVISRCVLR